MYLEHFNLHNSPFGEEIDPKVFFPGGGRDRILQDLLQNIRDGRILVKLTGAEGSGKTLMCHLLEQELEDGFEIVLLDDPVGSFDELLRVVCVDLGMLPTDQESDLQEELKQQLRIRGERGSRVVLILDRAEKIFLAALERLLRLLCELKEYPFTLVLSGRPALDANLEQLTVYCSGVELDQGYFLEPMNREETAEYLAFRLLAAGLEKDRQQDVFSDEAIDRIYSRAKGNPRMTSILAEEALQKSCSEKSFMVLLDHVDAEVGNGAVKSDGRFRPQLLLEKRLPFFIGAGLVLLLAAGIFLFSGGDGAEEQASVPAEPLEQQQEPIVRQTVPAVEPPLSENEPPVEALPEKPQPIPSPETARTVQQREEKKTQPEPRAEPKAEDTTPAVISLEPGRVKTPPEPVRAEPGKRKQVVSVGALEFSEKKEESTPAPEVEAPAVSGRDGDRLFEERLRASASWLAGAYRSEYTIQLMVLASERAVENVKKFLVQDEYYGVIDQLYILRKKTTPPTLFLFYGTFASMEDARQARNRMPIFLRKHHPYALSIEDALTKTED